jgi:2'-hydroxyisoflavone reductase
MSRAMPVKPARLLVLGGTAFVGRALTELALSLGHDVTLFNRGMTNPELFGAATKLRGDRRSDLSALAGRQWDAVIDVAAYDPEEVERSTQALADSVGHYVFVSTVSVYASHATTEAQVETAPTLALSQATPAHELYGARKAACEAIVRDAMSGRSTVARPGLIVGPHDPTVRFSYWPRRMAEGGRVLAPGDPNDPLQFIDVRDLAQWVLHAALERISGTFNVTGPTIAFGHLIDECRVPGTPTEVFWVSSHDLLAAGLDPWMGVPLWIGGAGWEAANTVDSSGALALGLHIRPLTETIRGARDHPTDKPLPLSQDVEKELLDRFGRH